jgi:hypothetical protein
LPIDEQIIVFRSLNSYLTYVSGGNVKFIGFSRCLGLAIGPKSNFVEKSSISFEDACISTKLNRELALKFLDKKYQFCLSHDYVGYNRSLLPPIICQSLVEESTDVDIDYYKDFNLDFEDVSLKLISAINYSFCSNPIYYGLIVD